MFTDELITRFLKYKRIITKLQSLGLQRVFSNNLGDALGITPALVRKDFSRFNLTGNRRGGYLIEELLEKINEIMGRSSEEHMIMIGCGNIGKALISHRDFDNARIVAAFDMHPIEEKIQNVPVYPMSVMETYVAEHKIKVAVLAVPEGAAAEIYQNLLALGIKGILNFTPVELKSTDECIINNVNIGLEIEKLFYMVNSSS